MPKLHQVLGLLRGRKTETEKKMGDAYKRIQKDDLFTGHERTYRPVTGLDDPNAEKLPPETKKVQYQLKDIVAEFRGWLVDLFDVVATLDVGNQSAKADIVVDGQTLAKDVPATTLLFLMKELENVKTFVSKLPTPDPAKMWEWDANQGRLATKPVETHRTKKTQKPIVLFPATTEHPAQTQMITEDVVAGFWTTIEYTSCVTVVEKQQILERVRKLADAVKVAKEKANDADVDRQAIGASLLGFVFGGYGA